MEAMRSAPAIARSGHPFPWLNLMVTEPFYLLHVLLFCSYFAARSSSVQSLPSDLSNHLIHREIQAFLAFLVLLVVKVVREETWEAFVADSLLYAKAFLFAIALVINYSLALCYLVAFLGIVLIGTLACTKSNGFWILDSGATDHMTGILQYFSSYTPSAGNQKIKIADGSFATVAGKGPDLTSGKMIGDAKQDGYTNNQKGYKCFDPISKKIFVSMDATFLEGTSYQNAHLQGENKPNEDECVDKSDLTFALVPNDALSLKVKEVENGENIESTDKQEQNEITEMDGKRYEVIFIIAQQPPYDGLESLLTEGNTSKFWLVEFRALCSSTYVCNSRIFPDLSVIYSNKNISFGIVDIGHFPNAAEKFGISLPGHIPTYILFENAVEIARLPEIGYAEISLPKISKVFFSYCY
ncbi:hypothetical protein ZIOFF_005368 [Zingiber officinale]|uniref:Uncharacterized protein n=1 Tax=Zingiber officinale TaxID=94328 RepID=A0A8J5LRM5_ZINOF|nr:hypothetical protein ZIOFF_005368 [Zingiber officinale]